MLPVLGQNPPERADAVRNRLKILEAAERLVALHGVDGLSMEGVASEAGVGVGTLYRRFGNRVGLANALLGEREREFQAAFMRGAPPLGPGAPPPARIEAFLHSYVDYLEAHTDLHRMAEAESGARYRTGAYGAHHAHLTMLLRQVHPDGDAVQMADALLAVLAVELYVFQRSVRNMAPQQIKLGMSLLARSVTTSRNRMHPE
jgi:AcrR family transcriptional regulator